MARITKIIGMEDHDSYAVVHVIVDGQEEATVFVGGDCEFYFDPKYDKAKAFVKKPNQSTLDSVNKDSLA